MSDRPRIGVDGYSVLPDDPEIVKRADAAFWDINAVRGLVKRESEVETLSRAFARVHGTLRACSQVVDATDGWLAAHELDLGTKDEVADGDPIRTVMEARRLVAKLATELREVLGENGDVVSWVNALASPRGRGNDRGSNLS